jgi:hypothetical protein
MVSCDEKFELVSDFEIHIDELYYPYSWESFFHFMWRFFVYSLVVLGFELSVLSLVGRHSITLVMPPTLFALVILEIGSHFLPRPVLTMIFLY